MSVHARAHVGGRVGGGGWMCFAYLDQKFPS